MSSVRLLRVSTVALLAGVLALSTATRSAQAQAGEQRAAIQVVEKMFAALAQGDTAGMRATFHQDGRVVQTGTKDGVPFARVNPIDDFLKNIGGAVAAGRKLLEKIDKPTAQVEDNLAVVWSRYTFYLDGKLSHCGVDSYQLVKGADGWKLLHIVDTQRHDCKG